jgi:hypothetical protein
MSIVARKILFDRSTETRSFESLLQRALNPDPSKDKGHARMVVPRASGGFPYVVELSAAPARFQARVHSRAAVIMTVHDPDGAVDGRPDVWREMFNLTPAEARVAMLTMRGMSDEAIARELQIGDMLRHITPFRNKFSYVICIRHKVFQLSCSFFKIFIP